MRNKFHTWISNFEFVLRPIGFTSTALLSLFVSLLFLSRGNIGFYSLNYLFKTFIIYGLLAMGCYVFFDTKPQWFQRIKKLWQQRLFIFSCLNAMFFPLMLLSGQREMLPKAAPLLAIFFGMGFVYIRTMKIVSIHIPLPKLKIPALNLNKIHALYDKFSDVKIKEKHRIDLPNNLPLGINPHSLLVNGAFNCMGGAILESFIKPDLKSLVLIDPNATALTSLQNWLQKKYPNLQVVTANPFHLNAAEIDSLIQTYKPEFVFDIDRAHHVDSSSGALMDALTRNLYLPKFLMESAIKGGVKASVVLAAMPLEPDLNLENALTLLECYAQRLDGANSRIIPVRSHMFREDFSCVDTLISCLWHKNKQDLSLSSTKESLSIILQILTQLLNNPGHHGSVWATTSFYKIKRLQLQKQLDTPDSLEEIRTRVQEYLNSLTLEEETSPHFYETSLKGAAILADCPIIETDFDQWFSDFEQALLNKDDDQVTGLLRVA